MVTLRINRECSSLNVDLVPVTPATGVVDKKSLFPLNFSMQSKGRTIDYKCKYSWCFHHPLEKKKADTVIRTGGWESLSFYTVSPGCQAS